MPTLVATIDVNISDRRSRRKVFSQRAAFGDLTDFGQDVLDLERGESKEFVFERCIFMYLRDIVDLQVIDSNNNVSTFTEVSGVFSLPTAGKVIVSVPVDSSISLARVIHVVRS